MQALRVAALQMPHGDSLDENLARARALVERAAKAGAGLALLPEYFFATPGGGPSKAAAGADAIRRMMQDASAELGLVVAGNVVEVRGGALRNFGVAYERGRLVLEQAKVHPMPREAQEGVAGGDALKAAHVAGHPVGMLVCADVLYPEASRILSLQGAEVLLNPVMSPYRADDDTKEAREAIYVARAYDSAAFVLKSGGYRRPSDARVGPPTGVAGRSLIAAPWGILARYKDDFTEEVLVADLDFDRLERFRERLRGFPARRPDAYGALFDA